jgi:hypothetical protein
MSETDIPPNPSPDLCNKASRGRLPTCRRQQHGNARSIGRQYNGEAQAARILARNLRHPSSNRNNSRIS